MKKTWVGAGIVISVGSVLTAQGCSSGGAVADAGLDTGGSDTGGGGMDAAMDTKKDSPGMMDVGPMCPTPVSLMNFTPPAYTPPRAVTSACLPAGITGYWDNCRGPQATAQACTTWKAANTACGACIESQRADSSWGPLIMANGITFVNIAGCLAIRGDMNCAKLDEDAAACTAAACDSPCPVTDFFAPDHQSTLADWQKCSQTAAAGACMSFESKFAMQCTPDSGNAAAACFNFQDFHSGYLLVAPMFCSGGG